MTFSFTNGDSEVFIYQSSVNRTRGGVVLMANIGGRDAVLAGEGEGFKGEVIVSEGKKMVKAELDHDAACILRELFPFTAPVPVLRRPFTFGVGDRLGTAIDGHIRAFEKYTEATPVFAQQSTRELNLTERTFEDVLDAVTFAVFKYGYKSGYGADGDHLKTPEEVGYALNCGYTMITLDCSEHIRNDVCSLTDEDIKNADGLDKQTLETYLNKSFDVSGGVRLTFGETELKRMMLIYGKAIDFASGIYEEFFSSGNYNADLEISIDETETPTTPLQHYFVANELKRKGVSFATIAPRFCGEFQKGIDYIGDIGRFESEFEVHAAIARHFGYKLSIHSGSDKFSVYPAIGRLTEGVLHAKTSGTSWLEALRVIAKRDPGFYRELHAFALRVFKDTSKLYHVAADPGNIPDISVLPDEELPALLGQNDLRQVLHIAYGRILSEKDAAGKYLFRDRFYGLLSQYRGDYAGALESHIGKHISLLLGKH